jgi:ADP-ribose pyrophosphatase YjhB (NUDIX family)
MTDGNRKYKKVAVAIVKNPQGKYLIVKRRDKKESVDGSVLEWAFPGTECDSDEVSREELARFVMSETGYLIKPDKKISERKYHPFGYELSYFESELLGTDKEAFELDKLDGFAWVDKSEFSKYFSTNIDIGLRKFLSL